MEQEIARSLMGEIAELNAKLNEIATTIERIGSHDERRTMRLGVANMMGHAYQELMRPIVAQYPALDPDRGELSR